MPDAVAVAAGSVDAWTSGDRGEARNCDGDPLMCDSGVAGDGGMSAATDADLGGGVAL